ncbi:MAG: beta-N-acetylhexosaminidase [Clostridia bacterium]|nr:beta-N-acetylhexosaminidase [Clostridia bacterium]
MKLINNGIPSELYSAALICAKECNAEWGNEGVSISAVKKEEAGLSVSKAEGGYQIGYSTTPEFLLGVSLICAGCAEDINARPGYAELGLMLDCSRNAVMHLTAAKELVRRLAAMGYTYLEMYCEDTYEVEGEPFFGYLRGRYSIEETKELEAYCASLGVDLVPCVQTLAHLNAIFQWGEEYEKVRDVNDILLAGEEQTYTLIERMFASLRKAYRGKRLHIGMDEAHMVGLGKYLDQHGYQNRFEILNKHLTRVIALANQYGFEPEMWSDMYFRLSFGGEYYVSGDRKLPEEVVGKIPEGVKLIYWDYYHDQTSDYEGMIDLHRTLGEKTLFAGGAWKWAGFAPLNGYSLRTMLPALRACASKQVDDVLVTAWGDNGGECPVISVTPSLLMFACYRFFGEDWQKFASALALSQYGCDYDDMMLMDLPNLPEEGDFGFTGSKLGLYSDMLLSFAEKRLHEGRRALFTPYAEAIEAKTEKAGELQPLFALYAKLCRILALKTQTTVDIYRCYQSGDKAAMQRITEQAIPSILSDINLFYGLFRDLWFRYNKAFGWEIHDARLGGLDRRIRTVQMRLNAWIKGELASVEELEGERVYPEGPEQNQYLRIVSVCPM